MRGSMSSSLPRLGAFRDSSSRSCPPVRGAGRDRTLIATNEGAILDEPSSASPKETEALGPVLKESSVTPAAPSSSSNTTCAAVRPRRPRRRPRARCGDAFGPRTPSSTTPGHRSYLGTAATTRSGSGPGPLKSTGGRWLVPTVLLFVLLPVAVRSTTPGARPGGAAAGVVESGIDVVGPRLVPGLTDEPQSLVITYPSSATTRPAPGVDGEGRDPSAYDSRGRRRSTARSSACGRRGSRAGDQHRARPPFPRESARAATSDVRLLATLPEALAARSSKRRATEVIGGDASVPPRHDRRRGRARTVGSKAADSTPRLRRCSRRAARGGVGAVGQPLQRRVATALKLTSTFPTAVTLAGRRRDDRTGERLPSGGRARQRVRGQCTAWATGHRACLPRQVRGVAPSQPVRSPLDDEGPSAEQVSMVDVWDRGPILVAHPDDATDVVAVPADVPRVAKPIDLRWARRPPSSTAGQRAPDRATRGTLSPLGGTLPPDDLVALVGRWRPRRDGPALPLGPGRGFRRGRGDVRHVTASAFQSGRDASTVSLKPCGRGSDRSAVAVGR